MTDIPQSIAQLIASFPSGKPAGVTTAAQRSFIQTLALRTPMLNVTDPGFGIDTTGVTDSTAALQTLLNGAGVGAQIYFPAGSLVLLSSVNLPSNVTLYGTGTLKQKTGTNANGLTNSGANRNITLDGITIDCNGNTYAFGQGVVWFSGVTDVVVKNCTMNAQCGGDTSTRLIYRDNKVSGGSMLFRNACIECAFICNRCDSAGAGNNAITINDDVTLSHGCLVLGNMISNVARIGIETVNEVSASTVAVSHTIAGNVITSTLNPGGGFPWGISACGGGQLVNDNNINIPAGQGNGIELVGGQSAARNNTIIGGANGIIVNGLSNGSPNTIVKGNSITNPGTYGIQLYDDVTDASIEGNTIVITNAAQTAIYENAGTLTTRNNFIGNTLIVASTDAVDSIYGMLLEGTFQKIIGNDIVITFPASHGDQAAIRIGSAPPSTTNLLISGNTLVELSAQLGIGVYAISAVADRWMIRDNEINGFSVGLSIATGTPRIVDNNMDGCTTNYSVNNTVPLAGTWSVGDRIWNLAPVEAGSASSKYTISGWVCTVAGTPGTWLPVRTLTGN